MTAFPCSRRNAPSSRRSCRHGAARLPCVGRCDLTPRRLSHSQRAAALRRRCWQRRRLPIPCRRGRQSQTRRRCGQPARGRAPSTAASTTRSTPASRRRCRPSHSLFSLGHQRVSAADADISTCHCACRLFNSASTPPVLVQRMKLVISASAEPEEVPKPRACSKRLCAVTDSLLHASPQVRAAMEETAALTGMRPAERQRAPPTLASLAA